MERKELEVLEELKEKMEEKFPQFSVRIVLPFGGDQYLVMSKFNEQEKETYHLLFLPDSIKCQVEGKLNWNHIKNLKKLIQKNCGKKIFFHLTKEEGRR